jgi:hypothetical protein
VSDQSSDLPYSSPRTFHLWRAEVGHGQLLLRANKSPTETSRIDLLFKPVRALKLRSTLAGIEIRLADRAEMEATAADSGETLTNGLHAYIVESGSFRGYVVAMAFFAAEDEGDYGDPSQLFIEAADLPRPSATARDS